jgi:pyridoxine kinase
MANAIPRAAAIHDMAGFGRCSLTVILPVLSVLGVQACPVPTALLSTHSGGFPGFSFHDLTQDMARFREHWHELGLTFDCLYSGFLGSEAQIGEVLSFFRTFRQQTGKQILVDPVMGDNGRRYSTYTDAMQNRMRDLVAEADIITPNLTEACFLLEEPYQGERIALQQATSLIRRLADMGPSIAVLTGLVAEDGMGFNLAHDRKRGQTWMVMYDQVPVRYPGTGDLFASAFLGCLLREDSLPDAFDKATQYLSLTVGETFRHGTPEREGVLFEKTLPFLVQPLNNRSCKLL